MSRVPVAHGPVIELKSMSGLTIICNTVYILFVSPIQATPCVKTVRSSSNMNSGKLVFYRPLHSTYSEIVKVILFVVWPNYSYNYSYNIAIPVYVIYAILCIK